MIQTGRKAKDLRLEEEQHLSNSVYFGLYALTQAHKPTTEFEKIFQKDLFVKSNGAALFHVIHFLFTIYDAEDFRKRFYWPLYNDREAEKTFRSACMKYLVELNEQFNLGMEDISTYVMLFPRGLKFLKIMEKLIKFVSLVELKRIDEDHLLESMTISHGNKMLRKLAAQKGVLDKFAADKLNLYTVEQQRINGAYQEYHRSSEPLAAKYMVSMDEFLSEKYQIKQEEGIRANLEELNRQKDVIIQYISSVETLQTQMDSVGEPTISNELIKKTKESTFFTFEQLPAIKREFGDCDLTTNDKVNVDSVLRLTSMCYPHLIKVIKEEIGLRTHTIRLDVSTINSVVHNIEQMMKKVEKKVIPELQNYFDDERTENDLTNTPNFKFDRQNGSYLDSSSRLLFQDRGELELSQIKLNQLQKRLNSSAKLAMSMATSKYTSLKTTKKPFGSQNIALSAFATTEKSSKTNKLINSHHTSFMPGKLKNQDVLNMSTMSSSSYHCSKISIDGHLPLGSSSMVANGKEFDDTESFTKYNYTATPAPTHRAGTEVSPTGRLNKALSVSEVKLNAHEDIPEEDNTHLSKNGSQRESDSFGDFFTKVVAVEDEESLFDVSYGVLKDID